MSRRMKRLSYALIFIFLMASSAFAAPVVVETARQVGLNWMIENANDRYDVADISEAATGVEQTLATHYIFNLEPDGWVIVSADDVAYPIIAYSPQGRYGAMDIPPAFEAWMQNVKTDIYNAVTQSSRSSSSTDATWSRLNVPTDEFLATPPSRGSVAPLLQTTWNQGAYYNQLCPIDSAGPDGHVWAGCVATAMAQVMKYHNHPLNGSGSHSYTPKDHPEYGV